MTDTVPNGGPFNWDKLSLTDIDRAPVGPGIYAWYYAPHIPGFRLEQLKKVQSLSTPNSQNQLLEDTRSLVEGSLYEPFADTPYTVRLHGPLKAAYMGSASQVVSASKSVVDSFSGRPDALAELANLISDTMPVFSSPVYVGMSSNLRRRLMQHRSLMYTAKGRDGQKIKAIDVEELERDQTFAAEVVTKRKWELERLFVFYTHLPNWDRGTIVAAEHIINRINYPICGRN